MDKIIKLKALCEQMSFEQDEEHSISQHSERTKDRPESVFIYPAILPNGQRIKLLKTMLSSACERDCYYCAFRAGRDVRRATFLPDEFAQLFMLLVNKDIVEGVLLSSGLIGGGIRSQDKLIDTASILRKKYAFNGYIHMKIMPGSEKAQVEESMLLADRVSINLEAPNDYRLKTLAPHKHFADELIQSLKWMKEIRQTAPGIKAYKGHWPSVVTQFVTGGSGETDLELLSTTSFLHNKLGLSRAYFSPFNPIPDTPLENQPPTPVIREHRLYQASFLLRDYHFDLEDLLFDSDGRLPVNIDPKFAWARTYLEDNPVEINAAEPMQLIRVPGIGIKGVKNIMKLRQRGKICDLSILKQNGIMTDKAAPYILLNGKHASYQLPLLKYEGS